MKKPKINYNYFRCLSWIAWQNTKQIFLSVFPETVMQNFLHLLISCFLFHHVQLWCSEKNKTKCFSIFEVYGTIRITWSSHLIEFFRRMFAIQTFFHDIFFIFKMHLRVIVSGKDIFIHIIFIFITYVYFHDSCYLPSSFF